MSVELIKRNGDVVLGNEDLELLYVMKNFPVYMGVTEQDIKEDLFADEFWTISRGSGMVQLEQLVPAHILYAKSHNAAIGKVWKNHHEKFADFLHENMGKEGILEIGGGNGILNSIYNEKYQPINWTIIEPSNVIRTPGCTANYLKSFWNESFNFKLLDFKFDTLVHTHLMEHQFDLQDFLALNRKALKVGGKMIFSIPNLKVCMENKYPYALNFEHTFLIIEEIVDLFLKVYGFELEDKSYFEDHSIFYSTKKLNEKWNIDLVYTDNVKREIYASSKKLFNDYIDYYKEKVNRLNSIICNATDKKVYIFGAHINTQLLLNFGLDKTKIRAILDNDTLKQEKRLYGTELMVQSPKILASIEKPLVILIMGAYAKEIKEDILENINDSVEFIS